MIFKPKINEFKKNKNKTSKVFVIFFPFLSIQTQPNKEKFAGKWTKPTINGTQIQHTICP